MACSPSTRPDQIGRAVRTTSLDVGGVDTIRWYSGARCSDGAADGVRGEMATEQDVGTEAEVWLLLQPSPTVAPPRVLRVVLAAVVLFITAIAMTIPVRPRLILSAAGNDASLASYYTGAVDALTSTIAVFSSPLLGAVSDVAGRRPVLLLSHVGELGALLIIARFHESLVAQFPAYMLIALTGAYVSTINTILADISTNGPAELSSQNYGYLGATFGLCFLVGPALGGWIDAALFVAASFRVAAVLVLAAMLFVYFFVPETKGCGRSAGVSGAVLLDAEQENLSRRVIRAVRNTQLNPFPRMRAVFSETEALTWLAATIAVSSLAQSGLNSILFLYVNVRLGWETKETGFFLSMVGLSLLVSQGVLAPLCVHYLGEVDTILLGYSFSALHYIIYGLARSSGTMYLGLVFGGISFVSEPVSAGALFVERCASKRNYYTSNLTSPTLGPERASRAADRTRPTRLAPGVTECSQYDCSAHQPSHCNVALWIRESSRAARPTIFCDQRHCDVCNCTSARLPLEARPEVGVSVRRHAQHNLASGAFCRYAVPDQASTKERDVTNRHKQSWCTTTVPFERYGSGLKESVR